ncbi:MAG TPA: TonB family protein [Chitinophagaceae bacterium]|nr:TonB family protein [Chitinophagaceae bacterium]
MTNNELLEASLLDILFEGRNKEYGAYALRRGYNRRMILSLAMGLSLIAFFILLSSFSHRKVDGKKMREISEDGLVIMTIPPTETIKPPTVVKPPVLPKAVIQKVAAIVNTTPRIVPDILVTQTIVPENSELDDRKPGTETTEGVPATGTNGGGEQSGSGNEVKSAKAVEPEVLLPSSSPEFPGGPEALKKFLGRNLNPPEELEAGEKKMVRVRFMVDKDGSVSMVNIETSGGDAFDKEVIRVCKKMPKWRPAIQNGRPATMSYVLPVTFITQEP